MSLRVALLRFMSNTRPIFTSAGQHHECQGPRRTLAHTLLSSNLILIFSLVIQTKIFDNHLNLISLLKRNT
jgi:hypothetical protein